METKKKGGGSPLGEGPGKLKRPKKWRSIRMGETQAPSKEAEPLQA